jgi:hypothetical protein
MEKEYLGTSKEIADEVDIGDFDLQTPSYQVWLLGYDADQNITDFSKQLRASPDPEAAVEWAKQYSDNGKFENESIPDNVAYVEVLVETIVDLGGYEENVGTLYSEVFKLE